MRKHCKIIAIAGMVLGVIAGILQLMKVGQLSEYYPGGAFGTGLVVIVCYGFIVYVIYVLWETLGEILFQLETSEWYWKQNEKKMDSMMEKLEAIEKRTEQMAEKMKEAEQKIETAETRES